MQNRYGKLQIAKSPTARLLVGLLVTLAAVAVFSWYSLYQLSGLRKLQTTTIYGNREASLLLLRVQNDLNTLGLYLRDMTDRQLSSGIAGYQSKFSRLQADLQEAIDAEEKLANHDTATATVRRAPRPPLDCTAPFLPMVPNCRDETAGRNK